MAVTEYAVLQLKKGFDRGELEQVLVRVRQRQDEWMRRHQPDGLEPGQGSLSTMSLGRDADHGCCSMLITAPWDSPQAHADWIDTETNQACNDELAGFVESVKLFHLEAAGGRVQLRGPFFPGLIFSVFQLSVSSHGRPALAEAYRALEKDRVGEDDHLWAGWRVEPNGEADETLMVFWGSKSGPQKLKHLMDSCDGKKQSWFRHVE
ncbi:hypothetical protein CDD80_6965 [Ophiocordyceps camponoti-rufipedis]|uniref:ABM domain-containing protein n=1 Tax=Ophiocordyceps camponoti-rufipedis TaxID=2004952 RepID=A0A2C5YNH9_9HYPO|nr:hypothetical protein CDD80_6965 [Ophiocordyceps camponoti-rufipedis]